jgi:RNA polymerase sigma-70 factor (ECF subfamily)
LNSEIDAGSGQPDGNAFATIEEARRAIEHLAAVDIAKLMLIAKLFARTRMPGGAVGPEDLLHDAILKTLDGTRVWNKKVSIVRHLGRVMESDAGHLAEKAQRTEPLAGHATTIADGPSAHEQVATRQRLNMALDQLRNDGQAIELIYLRGDGFAASEIRDKMGISETEYSTVCRRIARFRQKLLREENNHGG